MKTHKEHAQPKNTNEKETQQLELLTNFMVQPADYIQYQTLINGLPESDHLVLKVEESVTQAIRAIAVLKLNGKVVGGRVAMDGEDDSLIIGRFGMDPVVRGYGYGSLVGSALQLIAEPLQRIQLGIIHEENAPNLHLSQKFDWKQISCDHNKITFFCNHNVMKVKSIFDNISAGVTLGQFENAIPASSELLLFHSLMPKQSFRNWILRR